MITAKFLVPSLKQRKIGTKSFRRQLHSLSSIKASKMIGNLIRLSTSDLQELNISPRAKQNKQPKTRLNLTRGIAAAYRGRIPQFHEKMISKRRKHAMEEEEKGGRLSKVKRGGGRLSNYYPVTKNLMVCAMAKPSSAAMSG
jgi:hypothetical protein